MNQKLEDQLKHKKEDIKSLEMDLSIIKSSWISPDKSKADL